jgi:hypothetical protein
MRGQVRDDTVPPPPCGGQKATGREGMRVPTVMIVHGRLLVQPRQSMACETRQPAAAADIRKAPKRTGTARLPMQRTPGQAML